MIGWHWHGNFPWNMISNKWVINGKLMGSKKNNTHWELMGYVMWKKNHWGFFINGDIFFWKDATIANLYPNGRRVLSNKRPTISKNQNHWREPANNMGYDGILWDNMIIWDNIPCFSIIKSLRAEHSPENYWVGQK